MSNLKLKGATSGESIIKAPAVAGTDTTFTLPKASIDLSTAGSDGQFLKTDGAGTLSFATVSAGTALTGSTNNTVCTVTGANAIQGETGLTYDGNDLYVKSSEGYDASIHLYSDEGDDDADKWRILNAQSTSNKLRIASYAGGSWADHLNIETGGDLEVVRGNLKFANGKGIDFSAHGNDSGATGQSTDSEVLDEYEEGEWDITPNNSNLTFTDPDCRYTKIGNLVTCVGKIDVNTVTGSNLTYLELPFSCAHVANYGNASASAMIHTNIDAGGDTCGLFIPGNTANAWMFGSQNDGGWRHISNSHLSSSSEMVFTFSYRTT